MNKKDDIIWAVSLVLVMAGFMWALWTVGAAFDSMCITPEFGGTCFSGVVK